MRLELQPKIQLEPSSHSDPPAPEGGRSNNLRLTTPYREPFALRLQRSLPVGTIRLPAVHGRTDPHAAQFQGPTRALQSASPARFQDENQDRRAAARKDS